MSRFHGLGAAQPLLRSIVMAASVSAAGPIVSLLRVMTLRDAEAITLEAGKVPSLRRRR